ncbi:MAG: GerMN domain-containing protein [Clostridiales bacterium]|nr:GerMN domain-containing protein [Clostridiales bacterium]
MKRIAIIALMLSMAFFAAACGSNETGSGDGEVGGGDRLYIVNLCYADKEYIATGNENLPAVRYYKNHNLYCSEGNQYFALIDEALRENSLGIESIETMVTDQVKFKSVKVREGMAFVDMIGKGLSGSSLEEGLLISQIVYSLVGSFEEVERVQFLVDGKTAETLMGHYSVDEPFETGVYPMDM